MSETIELFEPEELGTEVDQASRFPHSDDDDSDYFFFVNQIKKW